MALRKKSGGKSAVPAKSAKPMHSHAGFITALVIALVVLLAAGVMAYLSWEKGLVTVTENISLSQQNRMLETANMRLVEENEEMSGEVFYHFEVDQLYATSGEESKVVWHYNVRNIIYNVYAQPRVGFDGRIFLQGRIEGDDPGLRLSVFDTESKSLSPLNEEIILPNARAMELSRDERHVAAIFDNPGNGYDSREIRIIDLIDGRSSIIGALDDSERFVVSDDGFGGSYGHEIEWVSMECVRALIYRSVEGSDNVATGYRNFCL